jgi:hypothetical protein
MQTAGARPLPEDDNEMSREAVLLQWERKIEVAEQSDSGRFVRAPGEDRSAAAPVGLRASRASAADAPPATGAAVPASEGTREAGRFERANAREPVAERRTITITGQPTPPPARRRAPVIDAQLARPDRIALWAFLLGLILVAVAAGTAHS